MIKKMIFLKPLVLTLLISFAVSGCNTQSKEPRYIPLNVGNFPMFIDTKTNEVYMVVPGTPPKIYKKSITDTEK